MAGRTLRSNCLRPGNGKQDPQTKSQFGIRFRSENRNENENENRNEGAGDFRKSPN
jgi:hypothetical protein